MKIYSDTLSHFDMTSAAEKARVDITRGGSLGKPARKRAFRWEIALSGDSPYLQGNGDRYPAATWDQWGIFLNALFEADPNMSTEYYRDRDEFRAVTDDRFDTLTYEQSHRKHDWRYMPIGRVLHFACNGCTAEQWPRDRKGQPMLAPTAPSLS